MTQVKNPLIVGGGGGADIVNSVVGEFLASGADVEANTFVSGLSLSNGNDIALAPTLYKTACATVDDTTFVAAYIDGSGNLTLRCCSISGSGGLYFGTEVIVGSATYDYTGVYSLDVVAVGGGKFVLACSCNLASYPGLTPFSVSGVDITVGTPVLYGSTSLPAICKFADGEVIVVSGQNPKTVSIYSVSDSLVLSLVASTRMGDTTDVGYGPKEICKLSDGKFAYAFDYSGSIYARIITVSDNIISYGSMTMISSNIVSLKDGILAVTPSSCKISAVYRVSSSQAYRCILSFTVSGTTINVGAQQALQLQDNVPQGNWGETALVQTPVGIVAGFNTSSSGTWSFRVIELDSGAYYQTSATSNVGAFFGAGLCVVGQWLVLIGMKNIMRLRKIRVQPATAVVHGITKSKATSTSAGKVALLN